MHSSKTDLYSLSHSSCPNIMQTRAVLQREAFNHESCIIAGQLHEAKASGAQCTHKAETGGSM